MSHFFCHAQPTARQWVGGTQMFGDVKFMPSRLHFRRKVNVLDLFETVCVTRMGVIPLRSTVDPCQIAVYPYSGLAEKVRHLVVFCTIKKNHCYILRDRNRGGNEDLHPWPPKAATKNQH